VLLAFIIQFKDMLATGFGSKDAERLLRIRQEQAKSKLDEVI
jgi:hypothetical protein